MIHYVYTCISHIIVIYFFLMHYSTCVEHLAWSSDQSWFETNLMSRFGRISTLVTLVINAIVVAEIKLHTSWHPFGGFFL